MNEKECQYNRIFEKTIGFGRPQLVREIQMQINDNKKKDKEIERLNNIIDKAIKHIKEHTENIDRGRYYEDYVETYDLLNILNGGDE